MKKLFITDEGCPEGMMKVYTKGLLPGGLKVWYLDFVDEEAKELEMTSEKASLAALKTNISEESKYRRGIIIRGCRVETNLYSTLIETDKLVTIASNKQVAEKKFLKILSKLN